MHELNYFVEMHLPLFNKIDTYSRMWEVALTTRPCGGRGLWKKVTDSSHCVFCECSLLHLVHALFEHILYKAMNTQCSCRRVASDERELKQCFESCIKLERIRSDHLEIRAEIS